MLYCPVRKKNCPNTPEEGVRIGVIHYLHYKIEVPLESIMIERSLEKTIDHRQGFLFPSAKRLRVDLAVWHQGDPFLLVECKAKITGTNPFFQLARYQHFIRATYLMVAHKEGFAIAYYSNRDELIAIKSLPNYKEWSKKFL